MCKQFCFYWITSLIQFTAQLCKNYINEASEGSKEHFKLRVAARENTYGFVPSNKHVLETLLFKRSRPNKYILCLIPSGYSEAAKDLSVPYCSGDFNIVLV